MSRTMMISIALIAIIAVAALGMSILNNVGVTYDGEPPQSEPGRGD